MGKNLPEQWCQGERNTTLDDSNYWNMALAKSVLRSKGGGDVIWNFISSSNGRHGLRSVTESPKSSHE